MKTPESMPLAHQQMVIRIKQFWAKYVHDHEINFNCLDGLATWWATVLARRDLMKHKEWMKLHKVGLMKRDGCSWVLDDEKLSHLTTIKS